jgi:starch synthase (maltosyl-transferring)
MAAGDLALTRGVAAPVTSRVVVEHVRPTVDGGAFASKATVGLPMEISADIFADGHEELLAWAVMAPADGARPAAATRGRKGATSPAAREVNLSLVGNDRWVGCLVPGAIGPWQLSVSGAVDDYRTWLRDLRLRHDDGQDVELELDEGRLLVEGRMLRAGLNSRDRGELDALAASLSPLRGAAARVRSAASARAVDVMRRTFDTAHATSAGPYPVWVDRELGGFSAWYEMFPRSEGATARRSGTFKTAAARLPAIAAMGFDIVYLPPIHPIGRSFRKGPNNTTDAPPDAVGSPWAIGAPEGGHTAVNPDLGSLEDFDGFVAAAGRAGLEVALDYALQCSPDHPWVKEHPQWFVHRPDGTIRYAENPPKRYQDIYPINFDTEDRAALDAALLEVMRFWIGHGVRVFRVDNPHTKPFDFWRWLIETVHRDHPEVIFLAEAFTRPRTMEQLAKVGFTQSYTYFTWRNTKAELGEYLTELSQGPVVDYFRPNFWVNTPDILHAFLQEGGPPAFRVRLVLAALACSSWGMYSGYELYENVAVRPGSEEYLDSEKYQLRPRDWKAKGSLAPMITTVNQIRRRHREAVALMRTLRLHHVDSEQMLCLSRRSQARDDVLLLVVNLDPHNVREATVWLDLEELGVDGARPYQVVDELSQASYTWTGPSSYVRLDPKRTPAHAFHVRQGSAR